MDSQLRVLHVDCSSGFYRTERFRVGEFFGPVDLGLYLSKEHNSLNIGAGLLAGSIFPGSNRLIFSGFSPNWGSFYISTMGGAALIFDNLGINMLALRGRAPVPAILYLNRIHGEEIEVEVHPIDAPAIWKVERPGDGGHYGVYALMDHALAHFGERYKSEPRILATGPAALFTDVGGIMSAPVKNGACTPIDTWAGRGGLGSKMLREHGIAAIIYGGTFIDEDFRDRKVADEWFNVKFQKKLAAKDMEATTKYRFDPNFDTGGTFGVNYAKVNGRIIAFNYRSIYMTEDERVKLHKDLVLDHYLKQFNDETIKTKSMRTCGEPCAAVCKKLMGDYKKDYEPYQTMGPLCGIFDQRAAEKLNHHADALGFDAISIGGVLAWLMECLDRKLLAPADVGATRLPAFSPAGFSVETDSMNNAMLGIEMLDAIIARRGVLDFSEGARRVARSLARERDRRILDLFLYNANARRGWMVPNQYWTPGVLSPMPIMGKYFMHYGEDFLPPRELGRKNAERFKKELVMDNAGFCRFHRNWAEDMIPEIMGSLYGSRDDYIQSLAITAGRINSRNSAVFWESGRCIDFVSSFLVRRREIEGDASPELSRWIDEFRRDPQEAALGFWFEIAKGVHESLREF